MRLFRWGLGWIDFWENCFVVPGEATPRNDIIGIVGRLAPVKNHRLFLEAAARIIKENPS